MTGWIGRTGDCLSTAVCVCVSVCVSVCVCVCECVCVCVCEYCVAHVTVVLHSSRPKGGPGENTH